MAAESDYSRLLNRLEQHESNELELYAKQHAELLQRLNEHGKEIREMRKILQGFLVIEDRQRHLRNSMARIAGRLEATEQDCDQLKQRLAAEKTNRMWLERAGWLMLLIIGGCINYYLYTHGSPSQAPSQGL